MALTSHSETSRGSSTTSTRRKNQNNSRHNPRRRGAPASTSTKKPVKRREFPQHVLNGLQPVVKKSPPPRPAAVKSSHEAARRASKYKTVVTPSRSTAAWQLKSVHFSLTIDTPGGHAPLLVIVKGIENLDESDREERINRSGATMSKQRVLSRSQPSSSLLKKTPARRVENHQKVALDQQNSCNTFAINFQSSHNVEDDDDSGDDEDDFVLSEAEDYYGDDSLPSIPCATNMSHPVQSLLPVEMDQSLDGASDAASIGDNDSTAIRMKQLLDALSVTSNGEEEEKNLIDMEGMATLLGHDTLAQDPSEAEHTSHRSDPSLSPPRKPTRTVSKQAGQSDKRQNNVPIPEPLKKIQQRPRKLNHLHSSPSFLYGGGQEIEYGHGAQSSYIHNLSRRSEHTALSADDTIDDSQVLPLSNLTDQPWACGDESGRCPSTSSEDEDSYYDDEDDDYSYNSEDDESAQVRKYVETMQMTKVDPNEVLSEAESADEKSIMEYYQRDRVTAMLMTMNQRDDDDDDRSMMDHLAYLPTKRQGLSGGTDGASAAGFDLEMIASSSINNESLTFYEGSDHRSLNSAMMALESPRTLSTKDTMSKLMSSLPSIEEDFLWKEASPKKQQAWLDSIQESQKVTTSPNGQDGSPKIPQRSISMDSDQKRALVANQSEKRRPKRKSDVKKAVASKDHESQKPIDAEQSSPSRPKTISGPDLSDNSNQESSDKNADFWRPNWSGLKGITSSPNTDQPLRRPMPMGNTILRRPSMIGVHGIPPNQSAALTTKSLKDVEEGANPSGDPILTSPKKTTLEIFEDSFATSPGFVQLDFTGGVKEYSNIDDMEIDMPDLDDIQEQEILQRIEQSKEKERSKKIHLFGRRKAAAKRQILQSPTASSGKGDTLLDHLWSYGHASSEMAKGMSDLTAYVD